MDNAILKKSIFASVDFTLFVNGFVRFLDIMDYFHFCIVICCVNRGNSFTDFLAIDILKKNRNVKWFKFWCYKWNVKLEKNDLAYFKTIQFLESLGWILRITWIIFKIMNSSINSTAWYMNSIILQNVQNSNKMSFYTWSHVFIGGKMFIMNIFGIWKKGMYTNNTRTSFKSIFATSSL